MRMGKPQLETSTAEIGFTNPVADMLGYELRRAAVAVSAALTDDLEGTGLRASEANLLLMIGANPGCTQSAVARALRVQPANLVPLIAGLERQGLVARQQSEGRAIALMLSPRGEEHAAEVGRRFARHERRLAKDLPPDQRDMAVALLRTICRNACCTDSRGEASG
jgi:DNA-binding MarR family transcriptional regulator